MINESGVWVPSTEEAREDINQELFMEKLEQFIKGFKK
jgi:hypothetical protein